MLENIRRFIHSHLDGLKPQLAPFVAGFDPMVASSERSAAIRAFDGTLLCVEAIKWRNVNAVQHATSEFLNLGFQHIGDFGFGASPPRVFIRLFRHETLLVRGSTIDGPSGITIDLNAYFSGERNLNVSGYETTTAPPPWVRRVFLPDASVARMLERLLADAGSEPRELIAAELIPADIERRVRRSHRWHASNGGMAQRDRIVRVALKKGSLLSDSEVDRLFEKARKRDLFFLDHLFREEFANLSSSQQERLAKAGRTVFIHERLTLKEAIEMLPRPVGIDLGAYPVGISVRESFRQITSKFPARLRPVFLMQLEQPVPADVYSVKLG